MSELTVVLLAFAVILAFLAGFYTGIWVQRHSYTDREVPKIVETQRVVEVEKPVIIQVPKGGPAPSGGSLAVMGSAQAGKSVLNPKDQQEAQHMQHLLEQIPEA